MQPVLKAAIASSSDPASNAFLKFSPALWHVLHTRTFFSPLPPPPPNGTCGAIDFGSIRVG